VFSQYWWPGNVRQLKNEIQRAVALSTPGGTIEPSHLSPEIGTTRLAGTLTTTSVTVHRMPRGAPDLASAVEQVERELMRSAVAGTAANIGETARTRAPPRRGLYLKMRRLGLDSRAEIDTH